MRTLFVDTATSCLVIGLLIDNQASIFIEESPRNHSTYAVEFIGLFLQEHYLTINDIDRIVVGVGPGSYTGIRVAVTIAKVLATTLNIPLFKISSLAFLTSALPQTKSFIELKNKAGFTSINAFGKQLSKDTFCEASSLNDGRILIISPPTIAIDLANSFAHATKVENSHDLVPNYARETEAQQLKR